MRRSCMLGLALAASAWSGACARSEPAAAPSFELRAVTAKALASLPQPAEPPRPDPAMVERLRGQIVDLAHLRGRMRDAVLQDVTGAPEPALVAASALLAAQDTEPEVWHSAIEALGAVGTPRALLALANVVDIQRCHDPRMRADAARAAGRIDADVAVPELCAQLKYETDGETVIWIADYLARQRNYSGLDGLRVLAGNAREPEVREHAGAVLAEVARDAGFDDPDALYAAWHSADPEREVPRKEPSPELRAAIWRCVADLGVFDLKHVDDARFVLAGSPWWVVDVLVQALHEQEPHLRACVAQSLERMGARATAACDELVKALDEPRTAPAMATALAAIGCRDAVEPLVRCTTSEAGPELRNAAARALGVLGGRPAVDALVGLLEQADSPDLRQTAAEALVPLGAGARGATLLCDCLTRPGADHDTAEAALEAWLAGEADAGKRVAVEALDAWRALAGDPNRTATVAETAERHEARAALLAQRLPDLLRP